MCGRYARRAEKQAIAEYFQIMDRESVPDFWPTFNIAPTTFQPIVRLNRDSGEREITMARWGLVPYWSKDAKIGYSTFNAKAETVATAPAYRESFQRRRCLIPADGFYEWKKLDARTKQPYMFAMKSGEPYAFAGVWDRWRDPAQDQPLESFTIITTTPNELTEKVHNRMPVIIGTRDYARWLEPGDSAQPPVDLLRPFDASLMTSWKVDQAVGNVKNDAPELCLEWE